MAVWKESAAVSELLAACPDDLVLERNAASKTGFTGVIEIGERFSCRIYDPIVQKQRALARTS